MTYTLKEAFTLVESAITDANPRALDTLARDEALPTELKKACKLSAAGVRARLLGHINTAMCYEQDVESALDRFSKYL